MSEGPLPDDGAPRDVQQPFSTVENARLRKFLQSHLNADSQRFLCLLGFIVVVQESPGPWARCCGIWAAGWLLASRYGLTRQWIAKVNSKFRV
jgi:hypothetical protein